MRLANHRQSQKSTLTGHSHFHPFQPIIRAKYELYYGV